MLLLVVARDQVRSSIVLTTAGRGGASAAELTRADARSYACSVALSAPAMSRGYTAPIKAAGFATMAWFGLVSPHRARRLLFSVWTFTLKSRPHLIARAVDGRRPDRLPEEKAER